MYILYIRYSLKEFTLKVYSYIWDKDTQCCGLWRRTSFVVYKSVMQQPRLGDRALPLMIMGMRMMVMLRSIEVKEERRHGFCE